MKFRISLVVALVAFQTGWLSVPRTIAETAVATVITPRGEVEFSADGRGRFTLLEKLAKLGVGSVVRTKPGSQALVELLPGFVVFLDANTEIVISRLDYTPGGADGSVRTVVIHVNSGRVASILERFFPGRTTFDLDTKQGELRKLSFGVAALGVDKCSRYVEVCGSSQWHSKSGHDVDIAVGLAISDCGSGPSKPVEIATDPRSIDDRAFSVAAIREAVRRGLVRADAFPCLADELKDLDSLIRDYVLNPANQDGHFVNGSGAPPRFLNEPEAPNPSPSLK